MLFKKRNEGQLGFYSSFEEQLSHQHPLYILANQIHWSIFEEAFTKLYSGEGRPVKPIRLMVSLLMLKHIRNLSDEGVVEQWMENIYYQYFSGEKSYACGVPFEASELIHFRNRIGEKEIELIFKESIRVNGKDGKDDEAIVDTRVQEKNITFPTDDKLHRKIIKKCVAMAEAQGIELRQNYRFTIKKLAVDQRFRRHPKNYRRARKADRKMKTIAGRLVRELERKLPAGMHQEDLVLFRKVLAQKRNDSQKVYSLHEPHVNCISKGKEHKKYEFGSKVSIIMTKRTGVIIGALNIPKNDYDAHTVEPAFERQQRLTGITLKRAFMDRGYRGISQVRGTIIEIPKVFSKSINNYQQQQLKKGFKRRASIEPKIAHLKEDHRLSRNYYKGIKGDNVNILLAAAAMNFKRMMNIFKKMFFALFFSLQEILLNILSKENRIKLTPKMAF